MVVRTVKSCLAYLYGSGAVEEIGDFCAELGLRGNAVLVCGNTTWKIAGEKISRILKENSFEKVEEVIVVKKAFARPAFVGAQASDVARTCKKIRSIDASVTFGIGGGINMDIAKAAASEEGIQCITVPTVFSTDAMCTSGVAVSGKTYRSKPVLGCVVDVDIIKSAPWRYQAAGFGDMMGKAATIRDWELACLRGKASMSTDISLGLELDKLQLELLMKNAEAIRRKEESAFNIFLQTVMLDGLVVELKAPVYPWGSDHIVAWGIQDFVKVLHGEAVGISTIMMVCHQGGDWESVKKALEDIGAPVTAKQLDISNQTIVSALTEAGELAEQVKNYYGILHERPLTEETAEKLARDTGVIE